MDTQLENAINEMLELLYPNYPNVNYIDNRMEFYNGIELIPPQVIRDTYPDCNDIDILSKIVGHKIAKMKRTPIPNPPFLEEEITEKKEIYSLQSLSLRLSC